MGKESDSSSVKVDNSPDKQNSQSEVEGYIRNIRSRLTVLERIYGGLAGFFLVVWCVYIFCQKVVEKIYWETEYDIADHIVFVKDILVIGVLMFLILFFLYQFIVYSRLKNRYIHSNYVLSLIKFAKNSEVSITSADKDKNSSDNSGTIDNEERKCIRAVTMDSLIKMEIAFLKKESKREWLLKMLES